jgi:hypothetical protein
MKKIIRKHSTGKLVLLEHITSAGGGPNFYTARAYEHTDDFSLYIGRCSIEGTLMGDMGQKDISGNTLEKSHKEVYRMVDQLFPELLNKGLKSEGYVKYSIQEIEKSGIEFEDH